MQGRCVPNGRQSTIQHGFLVFQLKMKLEMEKGRQGMLLMIKRLVKWR